MYGWQRAESTHCESRLHCQRKRTPSVHILVVSRLESYAFQFVEHGVRYHQIFYYKPAGMCRSSEAGKVMLKVGWTVGHGVMDQ